MTKRTVWNDLSPAERTRRVLHRWRECGQDLEAIAKGLGTSAEEVSRVLAKALRREVAIR
jgi:hypothetical protein